MTSGDFDSLTVTTLLLVAICCTYSGEGYFRLVGSDRSQRHQYYFCNTIGKGNVGRLETIAGVDAALQPVWWQFKQIA